MTETKYKFNDLLRRWDKAVEFINDENVPIKDRERWVPEATEMAMKLSGILDEIEVYNQEDVWFGFGRQLTMLDS